ncbi:endonuclease VII domain-containing protein [Streptomyces buecherae]|uniref:endonuclease VII domain-containing protein n=1 Tax=Streptomyces buecherae TaxID=2763006 RepID=UPI003788E679
MAEPRKGYRQCARCERSRAERFYSPRGRVCQSCRTATRRRASRDARIRATYGLTAEEYARLLEHQGGRCAICLETRRGHLAVDHSHKSGAIRGLLCGRCNGTLLARGARDRPEVLRRAAEYLESYPCDAVLGRRYVPPVA